METIRVTVRRNSSGDEYSIPLHEVIVSPEGRELPSTERVLDCLAPKYRKLIKTRRSSYATRLRHRPLIETMNTVGENIPEQAWADAIGQAIIMRDAVAEHGAVSEIAGEGPMRQVIESSSPMMLVGDMLYRLNPVETVNGAKALTAMKRRMTEQVESYARNLNSEAERYAESVKAAARSEAQSIVRQAEIGRQQLEEEKRRFAREHVDIPPYSLLSLGFMLRKDGHYEGARWELGRKMTVLFSSFTATYGSYILTWTLPEPVASTHVVWMVVDAYGNYDISRMRLEEGVWPHMSANRACVTPQGIPSIVTRSEDLYKIWKAVERTYDVINLSSLLNKYEFWEPDLQNATPQGVKDFMAGNHPEGGYHSGNGLTVVSTREEAASLWRL